MKVMQITYGRLRARVFELNPARTKESHDPYASGLHHLCFQTHSKEAVDRCYQILQEVGVDASEPQYYPEYHPEYYATFFNDPDGIRLEIVGRTPYRDEIAEKWENFEVSLNPLQSLRQRDDRSRSRRKRGRGRDKDL